MTFRVQQYEDLSVGNTSSRAVFPVGDYASGIVWAETKATAWGTAVLAVKGGPTANGPFIEFSPQIRIGPPSATAVCSPLLDLSAIGYLEVSVATAESGESVRVYVTGEST